MKQAVKAAAEVIIALTLVLGGSGCGAVSPQVFPNQVISSNGQPLLLDEIEAIVRDGTLSDAEKREQLRALGLEDEKLMEALLSL